MDHKDQLPLTIDFKECYDVYLHLKTKAIGIIVVGLQQLCHNHNPMLYNSLQIKQLSIPMYTRLYNEQNL